MIATEPLQNTSMTIVGDKMDEHKCVCAACQVEREELQYPGGRFPANRENQVTIVGMDHPIPLNCAPVGAKITVIHMYDGTTTGISSKGHEPQVCTIGQDDINLRDTVRNLCTLVAGSITEGGHASITVRVPARAKILANRILIALDAVTSHNIPANNAITEANRRACAESNVLAAMRERGENGHGF